MDGKTPHLLPLSAAKKKIHDDVPPVCTYALLNALAIVFGTAVGYIAVDYLDVSCSQLSSILPCVELTDAESAWLTALSIGILCCAPTQAAAAALALLLPCRRRRARRALAYLALAVTFLFHCMYAGAVWTFLAADPRYISGKIFFTMVIVCLILACNLTCLSDLLGGDGSDKQ
ncbi:uncharacterized protein LOC125548663 [Triticum urartu]|uniref:Uncharacterized protein n=1 Tax=Triticum urartu TaxID=4572 RepID=A0A8R7PTZ7_TRIUA|nr:uncharacterized protein LOC125548655 [Triticum urartu]XP_048568183.1 uncharacterized protein LOC125548663 [Triticum urartu]